MPKKDEYHEGKDRKAFEFDYANQLWQADTTYLGKIDDRQTYLMMIFDDASRMAVSFEVLFADNAVNFQKILKNGVKTYGSFSVFALCRWTVLLDIPMSAPISPSASSRTQCKIKMLCTC